MIKTLIFDWGGVCTEGHLLKDFSAKLSVHCQLDKKILEETFKKLEYPYETGKIPPEEFWNMFKEDLRLELSIEKLQSIFHDSYTLNEQVMELILSLKKTYQLILLTNNYEDLFTYIKSTFDLEKYFDFMFSSSDIHYKKPSRDIYQHVLDMLKINPKESIIIDDKAENLHTPEEMGFNTILFKDSSQLKKELTSFSIRVD